MAFEKFELGGRTGLITGAAGLLGREHASALIESGASVVLTDINQHGLESTKEYLEKQFDNAHVLTAVLDVCSNDSVIAVSKQVKEYVPRIDILINNAAVNPTVGSQSVLGEASRLENLTTEEWSRQLDVGLTGAFLCSKVFGSQMAEDGLGGTILNISSDLSVFSPDQRIYRIEGVPEAQQPVKPVTYSVIKTGLIGLTRYLATYWVGSNVRCNAISPGGVEDNQDPKFVDKLTSLIPMNRMATVDEYRSTIQFLCSDASQYLTGQSIVVDGGRSVW